MFYSFLVADPRSGLHYRLTDTTLAELALAPKAAEWAPGRAIVEDPDPVWRDSLANAPIETISAVSTALEGLVLATGNLRAPAAGAMEDNRARRHLNALIELWLSLFLHDFTAWFSRDFWMVVLEAAWISALRVQFHLGLQ